MSSLHPDTVIYNLVVLAIIASGYLHLLIKKKYHYCFFSAAGTVAVFIFYFYRADGADIGTLWRIFITVSAFFVIVSLLGAVCTGYLRMIKNNRR